MEKCHPIVWLPYSSSRFSSCPSRTTEMGKSCPIEQELSDNDRAPDLHAGGSPLNIPPPLSQPASSPFHSSQKCFCWYENFQNLIGLLRNSWWDHAIPRGSHAPFLNNGFSFVHYVYCAYTCHTRVLCIAVYPVLGKLLIEFPRSTPLWNAMLKAELASPS